MNSGLFALPAVLGIGLGILAAPASAAPALGANAGGVKAAIAETSPIEQARWHHRCWRDRWGYRHCRRVWIGPSYGYGPGIYFGGGGHRHHYPGHGYRGDHSGHGYRRDRGGGHMGGDRGGGHVGGDRGGHHR